MGRFHYHADGTGHSHDHDDHDHEHDHDNDHDRLVGDHSGYQTGGLRVEVLERSSVRTIARPRPTAATSTTQTISNL